MKGFNPARLGLLVLLVGAASAAVAAYPPAAVIQARQQNFKSMGAAFKAINDELRSGSPDKAKLAAAVKTVERAGAQIPRWFPKGSGPETGVKTAAKAEIWTDSSTFKARTLAFSGEASKLRKAIAGTDINAIREQQKATGRSCGECHKLFRQAD